jgi:hypothetical protein
VSDQHFVDSQIGRDRDRRCENSRRMESEMIMVIDRKEGRGPLILAPFGIHDSEFGDVRVGCRGKSHEARSPEAPCVVEPRDTARGHMIERACTQEKERTCDRVCRVPTGSRRVNLTQVF